MLARFLAERLFKAKRVDTAPIIPRRAPDAMITA
jgi:hypothetical protein